MDLRLSVRALARRPTFTLLAIGALALGVGGTTAVYSLVHSVLVEGLPYDDADRIVTPDVRAPHGFLISISIPDYRDWGERSRSFESWGGSAGWSFIRPDGETGAELLSARLVLGDFFDALALRPQMGRVFSAAEADRGATPVAVISHSLWQRGFAGDPGVIGRPLVTDRFSATIIGVLPEGTGYPSAEVEAYVPMGVLEEALPWDDRHSSFGTRAIARLAPGVTLDEAQADLGRVAREIEAEEGQPVAQPELRALDDLFLGDVRAGLWVLMGAVGLLLLIACANVANLALARGEGRGGELAVRTALGAGRRRLVTLLLTESALLAAAGGALGLAVAAFAVRVLPGLLPLDIPSLVAGRVGLDGPVLAFALGVTALSALLFGLIPALRLGAAGEATRLRQGGRATAGRDARRLRDGLVVTQVALSLVLLVAAGLLAKSLGRLARVDKGFVAENVITARLQAPGGTFTTAEHRHAFYEALIADLEASPEVRSAAATLLVPLTPRSWERGVAPEGAESLDLGDMPSVLYNRVSEGYFETLGIPLLRGRGLLATDREGTELVAVIDQTMAERFWPGEDPVGKRITFEQHGQTEGPRPWLTVVGVVPNIRHYELETPSRIQVYVPMRQAPPAGLSVAVRHRAGAAAAAAERLRAAVNALQPGTAMTELRPMEDLVSDELGPNRALGLLTGLFATFAVLLAALGIFGALSLAVARRRKELGVRLAVGATPAGVLGLVARYGLVLGAAGSLAGVVGALAANRVLGSVLYDVRPFDPGVYGLVIVGMLTVAVAAAAAPATRAARTDPARVLREE